MKLKGDEMKKLFALMVILLVPLAVWAADPTHEQYCHDIGSVTVDSVFDGTWQTVHTAAYTVASGAATVMYTIEGVAIMDPGDKLWLGIGNDSASLIALRNLDSMVFNHFLWNKGRVHIPFSFSTLQDTAAHSLDTIYWTASCGGTGRLDAVNLTNVFTTITVMDTVLDFSK